MFRFFCCSAKSEFKQNTIVPEAKNEFEPTFIDPDYEFRYYPFPGANLLLNDITFDDLAAALMTVFEGHFIGNKYIKANLEDSIQPEMLCRSIKEATEKHEPSHHTFSYIKFQLSTERLAQDKISLTLEDIHSIVNGSDKSYSYSNEKGEVETLSGADFQNWLAQNISTPYSPK